MNAQEIGRRGGGDVRRYGCAPVTALSDEAFITEPAYEHDPGLRDAVCRPSNAVRLIRKSITRQRRYNDIECVASVAAVSSGIRERADHFPKFHDRPGPPMGKDDG